MQISAIERHIDTAKEAGLTLIKVDRNVYDALLQCVKAGKRLREKADPLPYKETLAFDKAYQRITDL